MLKGIDPLLTSELLMVMHAMGHGDDLLICDRNHPAAEIARHTVHGRVIHVRGAALHKLAEAILTLLPLDTFVEAPIARMEVVGDPGKIVAAHQRMQQVADDAYEADVMIRPLERFAFYAEARKAFAVVQTGDPGPYGCFLIKKGVL
jgi:L-fucose mutarotase